MSTRTFGTVAAVCLCLAVAATAGTFTDASLASPPGFYNGTNNPNAGFTVQTNDANLELGLGAIIRYLGPATETGSTYFVPTGKSTVTTGSTWGVNYSVNTRLGENGNSILSDYAYLITFTDGTNSASFDPLNPGFTDNYYYGSRGTAKLTAADETHNWGFQNSEAPSFFFIAIPLNFDQNAVKTYTVTLTATAIEGGAVLTDTITVNAQTPEPATMGLMGSTLLGLGLLGRRLGRSK